MAQVPMYGWIPTATGGQVWAPIPGSFTEEVAYAPGFEPGESDPEAAVMAEHLAATLPARRELIVSSGGSIDPNYEANRVQYAREYVNELKLSGAIDPADVSAALLQGRPADVLVAYDQLMANRMASEAIIKAALITGEGTLSPAELDRRLQAAGAVPVTVTPGVVATVPVVPQAFPGGGAGSGGGGARALPPDTMMLYNDDQITYVDPGSAPGGGGAGGALPPGSTGPVNPPVVPVPPVPLPGGGGGGGGPVVEDEELEAPGGGVGVGVLAGAAVLGYFLLRRR